MVMEEHAHLVARLPAEGYGTTEFDMTDARRNALVDAARTALAVHLDTPAGLVLPTTKAGPGTRLATAADRVAVNILQ
jgi:hypothetical protein